MTRLAFHAACVAAVFAVADAGAAVLRVGATQTYATIQAALNAASTGDLILVDPGTYAPFDINGVGVAVLSANQGQPFTMSPSTTRPVIRVLNLAAGQSATVSGWQTTVSTGAAAVLEATNCVGPVRIEQAVIDPVIDLINVPMRGVIEFNNCSAAVLFDVQIVPAAPRLGRTTNPVSAPAGIDDGIAAVIATNSKLHAVRTRVRGYSNYDGDDGAHWGGDALRLFTAASVRIDDSPSLYRGGDAPTFGGSVVHMLGTNPVLDVKYCGIDNNALVKGQAANPGGYLAVNHDRGVVSPGVERFVPGCLFDAVGYATQASRAVIGSSHAITVSSFYPRSFILYIGPSTFQKYPGIHGVGYLDYSASTTVLLANGTLGTPPVATVSTNIPNVPTLAGWQFECQALLGPPQGMSMPAVSFSLTQIAVVVP